MNKTTLGLALVFILMTTVQAQDQQTPKTIEDLWVIIQQQQERIEELEKQGDQVSMKLAETDQKVDATGDYVEQLEGKGSALPDWVARTRLSSYGEMHYNNLKTDDGVKEKEIDFHRFVIGLQHDFNDDLRMVAEVELEHSVVEDTDDGSGNGEWELEQAYIEYDISDNYQTRGGVFLLPIGILNETHEPNTYYGVERNDVESIIIPATWWEGGALVGGRYSSGISWDAAITSGLKISTDDFRVRSGRQKVSEADASDLAYTGRLKYTGIPGLELATSIHYQKDASQQSGDGLDEGLLLSAHVAYNKGPFGIRALWAQWDFDGDAVEAAGADQQDGWYVEPSWKVNTRAGDIGFYTRYEDLDAYREQDQFDQWEVGFNYWPIDQVVLKFDYRDRSYALDSRGGDDFDGFDLGLGYSF